MATLSILGLYRFDDTIFDDMQIPAQIEHKKDDLITELLMQLAELEVIYPDVELMRAAIKSWSTIQNLTWSKYAAATFAEYNPLWNVDATITENRTGASVGHDTTTGSNTETDASTAFNSGSMANRDQASVYASQSSNDGREWNEGTSTTRTGNIGVTTSQQLIMAELEVAKQNIIMYIINDFKRRFCLMVY